jgi:hypothetical protein
MIVKKAATESDFRRFIKSKYADIVILTEPFETFEPIHINRAVRIMCANVAFMQYNTYHPSTEVDHAAIYFNVPGIIADEFVLKGLVKPLTTYAQHTNPPSVDGLQSGIKIMHGAGDSYVVNSILTGFNWGRIWAFDGAKVVSMNNTFAGLGNEYYNYDHWHGGRGNASGQNLYVSCCNTAGAKHFVGSSGHPNSYYASGNTIYNTVKAAFDRHSDDIPKVGGMNTHITGNTIYNTDKFAFTLNKPYAGGSVVFAGNRLARVADKPVGEISIPGLTDSFKVGSVDTFIEDAGKNYFASYGNEYGI